MASYSDLMQMCRLCLVKDQVNLPIFGGQGDIQQIFLKITACLPVKVSREDNLPKSICDGCSYKLDLLYQFWNTSSNSEKQLIDWLTAAGVDPKHKSLEPIGLASQPNVILKQEPVTELDAISSDTQNYLMQQQQLAYKPEEYEEPQQDPIQSTKKKATSESADETPSKRPRRATRNTKSVQEVDDSEEDYVDNSETGIAKTEDESEEEEEDEEDDEDGEDVDDGDDMADPDFVAEEDADADADQPGPSGVSGSKSSSATEIDDVLTPIVTISEVKKKKRGRPRKSDAEKQAAKDAKHEVKKAKAKNRMHSCEVCGKRFKTSQLMKQHVTNFHSNIYNCNECAESFNTPLEYSIHMKKTHTEDTNSNFQCVLCDFETAQIEELKTHLKKCSDRAPRFTCTICKKGFNVRTWYLEHANYHTGDKPFVCEICGKAFIYSRYLSAHRSTQHKFNGEEKKLHHCTLCDKVYQHRNSLAIHMNTHTGNGAVCDICGKLLSSKEKLKFHMRIHSGYKPFKCTYCEKAFIKKTILVEHIRIHTGEKPYRCEYCHKCFSQRSSMVTHVRGHTGERPHVCHFCGKGFVAKAMLNLHFKTCKGYNYPPQQ